MDLFPIYLHCFAGGSQVVKALLRFCRNPFKAARQLRQVKLHPTTPEALTTFKNEAALRPW